MKRKRDSQTGRMLKYETRLNVDGSRMNKSIYYDKTHIPIANWLLVRLLLALVTAINWYSV